MDRLYQFTQQELERLLSRAVASALRENAALNALGDVLIEADHVTKAKDLSPKTISQNKTVEKYNQVGKRKLLMKLEDVNVLKNRRRK